MRNALLPGLLAIFLLSCSNGSDDLHRSILAGDLKRVTYDNGIAMDEAKIIAEAYLFVYGGKSTGPAPQVYIHDGGKVWLADIASGTAIHPQAAGLPPVQVSKANGDVRWKNGPDVHRVDLSLAPKKDYFDPSDMPSDGR